MENNKGLIVVTGGSKGIGKAIILKYIKEGYTVATCSRKEADLALLQSEVVSLGGKLHYKVADLSDRAQINSFAAFVKELNIPVSVLVNNTGVFIPGQIHQEEDGILEQMINTNLYSAYHLTRALIGDMVARKSGYIFNICSIASITAYPNGGSYSVSKFALYGMSKVLREEMKEHGVRVTAILPGATLTASWDGVDLPEERFIKADDIADAVWSAYKLSGSAVVEEMIIRPQLGDI